MVIAHSGSSYLSKKKVLAVFQLPARGLLPTGGLLGHYSTTGLGGKTWSGDPNTNYLALPYLPVLPRKTNKKNQCKLIVLDICFLSLLNFILIK